MLTEWRRSIVCFLDSAPSQTPSVDIHGNANTVVTSLILLAIITYFIKDHLQVGFNFSTGLPPLSLFQLIGAKTRLSI